MHHAVCILYSHEQPPLTNSNWMQMVDKSGLTGNTGTHPISGHIKADLYKPSIT